MREIEFRGKDFDYNKWIYGSLVINEDGSTAITEGARKYGYQTFSSQVIPETVGQYTGLKDRDGAKIYEGDIVKTAFWNESSVVEFVNGGFEPLVVKWWACEYDADDYTIIGNIHDNSELVGGTI